MLAGCFGAGTPLLTPEGSKPIEQFRPGDLILSRDENDPAAPVEARVVEDVFVRTARILELRVGGQVIRTTAEHPFWVKDKGWTDAGLLETGDLLSSLEGHWFAVEAVCDTEGYETVYNIRVAEYHTYFVGCLEWGWNAWAHNQCTKGHVDNFLKANELDPKQVNTSQVARWANSGKTAKLERHLQTRYPEAVKSQADAQKLVQKLQGKYPIDTTRGEKVVRMGSRRSPQELAAEALAAERDPRVKIHGVSVYVADPTKFAQQRAVGLAEVAAVQGEFPMYKTMGRGHYTVGLPKPVTPEVAERFHNAFDAGGWVNQ
jgi:hypothetical protein